MSVAQLRSRPTGQPPAYCPSPINSDAARFGLVTSFVSTPVGMVAVRHGRRTRSGTATILLHGAAGSWTTWTPLLAVADRGVDDGLTDVVIPDLPGWGDSPLPGRSDATTIPAMARAVAELARSLGYRRWRVIGHSMGGFIALHLASTEVRATQSVGLVSTTTFSVIDSVRHPVSLFGVLPGYTALLQAMRVLGRLGTTGGRIVRGLHRMWLLRPLVSPLFRHPSLIDRSVLDALALDVRPRSFALASARAGDYDAERLWSRIECPVRAVHGDRDVFVAATDDARLAAVIGGLRVVTIADSGHFCHIERPDAVLAALADADPSSATSSGATPSGAAASTTER